MTYTVSCIACGEKYKVTAKDLTSKLYCDLCQKKVVEIYIEKKRKI